MNVLYVFLGMTITGLLIQDLRCVGKKKINNQEVFGQVNCEWCKVFAALFIMYGHTVAVLKTMDNCPAILNKLHFGWHWVALFFLLSGYGVTFGANNKKEYMRDFIKKRLVKVLIPFISAHIIYFAIKFLTGTVLTIRDIFWGLMGQLNVVEYSWYPVASVVMYIMFAVIWRLKLSDSFKIMLLFVSNIAISFILWYMFGNKDWWYISNLAFSVGCAMYYLPNYYKHKPIYIVCVGVVGYIAGIAIIPISYKIVGGGITFKHILYRVT